MSINSFQGFPSGTLKFLRGVRKNNSKKWFDAHRSDYDEYFVGAAKQFVVAVGAKLEKIIPAIVTEPKINGSIFRINRDVRFSNDKRPYKDHLDFAFWEGEKRASSSSLFFRLSPDGFVVGAGYHACPQLLNAFRGAVADSESGKSLAGLARKLRKSGHEFTGQALQTHATQFSRRWTCSRILVAQFSLRDARREDPGSVFARASSVLHQVLARNPPAASLAVGKRSTIGPPRPAVPASIESVA